MRIKSLEEFKNDYKDFTKEDILNNTYLIYKDKEDLSFKLEMLKKIISISCKDCSKYEFKD